MKQILLTFLLFISVCLGAVLGQQTGKLKKEYINPANGYTQVVAVESDHTKTLYISGQIGEGKNLEDQIRSALSNLEKQLKDAGADFTDIVKMNTYIVNYQPEHLNIFSDIRKEMLGTKRMPASTLIGVQSLALSQFLVEIEAIAVMEKD